MKNTKHIVHNITTYSYDGLLRKLQKLRQTHSKNTKNIILVANTFSLNLTKRYRNRIVIRDTTIPAYA